MSPCVLYFVKGLAVGLSVAAPIGPVAIYCMQQTLSYGLLYGIVAGIAVSLADAFYSWVAAYSAGFVESIIQRHSAWFYVFGGLFLLYLSYRIFKSPFPTSEKKSDHNRSLWSSFTSTLVLTLASPMTTLLFIGMFTAYGVFEHPLTPPDITGLVMGVGLGAMGWWLILTTGVNFVQRRYNTAIFKYINYVSGTAIAVYGLYSLIKGMRIFF